MELLQVYRVVITATTIYNIFYFFLSSGNRLYVKSDSIRTAVGGLTTLLNVAPDC
jgi:hypothetical protein